ncbi:MAG: hypothetical protein HY726_14340 [Candidatus Rokubacteria bacterium]|nr:hypothetical protein [Candidatus Rokubacteria bacterium]
MTVGLGPALCLPFVTGCAAPPRHRAAGIGAAQGLDVRLQDYREAARAGVVGTVTGRVYVERAKPDGADTPLADVAVILVPHSEKLLGDLEALKREARHSLAAYHDAAARIQGRLEAYGAAVAAAAGAQVMRAAQVNADGMFRLDGIPAGQWLLYAARALFVPIHGSVPTKQERKLFRLRDPVRGHRAITAWLRELTVAGGEVEVVELTDRNRWFTGMVEERGPNPMPPSRGTRGAQTPRDSPR